ncbi:MAG: hypothetical protein ABI382_02200 [Nakamurella sp.]
MPYICTGNTTFGCGCIAIIAVVPIRARPAGTRDFWPQDRSLLTQIAGAARYVPELVTPLPMHNHLSRAVTSA